MASMLIAIVMVLFATVWGSVFLSIYAKKYLREGESGAPDALPQQVREDLQLLEARLSQVEEEVAFYRELRSKEVSPQLEAPPAEEESRS